MIHLCGHVGHGVLLSDGCNQAGDVNDVSLMLAKVRQRQLHTNTHESLRDAPCRQAAAQRLTANEDSPDATMVLQVRAQVKLR